MVSHTSDHEDFYQQDRLTDLESGDNLKDTLKHSRVPMAIARADSSNPESWIFAYYRQALDSLIVPSQEISQSAYDIAIASFVPGPHQASCIRWLSENRNVDGTWGAESRLSWHDCYLATYAVAVAFQNAGLTENANQIVSLLPGIVVNRDTSVPETVTFGGLVGALDVFASLNGILNLTHHPIVAELVNGEKTKWQKMRTWPAFYDPSVSVAGYSAECIYGSSGIDLDRFLQNFQVVNDSIATSPSASASLLLEIERTNAQVSEEKLARLRAYAHGLDPFKRTVGHLDYIPSFVTGWGLMFVSELGIPYNAAQYPTVEARINEACKFFFNDKGYRLLSIADPTTLPGDADSTSCTVLGINYARPETFDLSVLEEMYVAKGGYYQTFKYERDPALTTNIHMAGILASLKGPHLDSLLRWLQVEITDHHNIICKWHISPLYVMGEIARILAHIDHSIAQGLALYAGDYLLAKQKADGSWGFGPSTVEETGYAVLGLAAIFEHLYEQRSTEFTSLMQVLYKSLTHAKQYLQFIALRSPNWQNEEEHYPPLWIGKPLYTVRPLVPVLYYVSLGRIAQIEQKYQRLGMSRKTSTIQRDRSSYIS